MHVNPSHPLVRHDIKAIATGRTIAGYFVGAVILWATGTQFAAGWNHSTQHSSNYSTSIVEGLYFILLLAVAPFLLRRMRQNKSEVSVWLALGFACIFFIGAFPVAGALGSIWNALAGSQPNVAMLHLATGIA